MALWNKTTSDFRYMHLYDPKNNSSHYFRRSVDVCFIATLFNSELLNEVVYNETNINTALK